MNSLPHVEQTKLLSASAAAHSLRFGADLCIELERESLLLLSWLEYSRQNLSSGVADELLRGTRCAIVEAAACLTLGLVRPSIFSIRAQIDMALAWLYFKDHEIEWQQVQDEGEGFRFKKEVLKYLNEFYPGFNRRFEILKNGKKRKTQDPYALLSAHVHSQSVYTIPTLQSLSEVVCSIDLCRECVTVQSEVSEYINDVFLSCFADKWHSLPTEITDAVKKRLPDWHLRDLTS